ncbi:hypothetical protein JKF63_01949 [Porcisia hertigi]|uniref:Uncharacterized protein n=1 Tax=Porcisia hertigi TaxID=2761500 RepID=A0A836HJX3_9TRYP|nr:hypothetical protein JKF63_01949 [Porcisia hertigi]
MSQLSDYPQKESVAISELFARYLKANNLADQLAITRDNPLLFTDDIVAALKDARVQIDDTLREVRETCRMIDAVSGNLEYMGTGVALQPSESKALLEEDTVFNNFATHLASLLRAREKAGSAAVSTNPFRLSASPFSGDMAASRSNSPGAWFTQPALVFNILSFLSAEEILMEAENVCSSWQMWLFQADMSRFFWVGCVQREFLPRLQPLLESVGDDLYESDWRSFAMLCVAEAEQAKEAEGGG